ncbi:LutC/YkgG family protein [Raineyella fluvialis]|uniref:Lactate utilization protein C n=1 Tax=Raineyella fluvialis TaxID=2662261 RepID=A0A5Q2FBD3_9ACTN|nr:lactate utilization protein C [Raineyella fluvialis]QGF24350.1 lactate utilization protein C [Raineyella fluvialis]
MSARDDVLARVRASLTDVAEPDGPVDWAYGLPTAMADVVDRFVETVTDYKATVVRCGASELPGQVMRGLMETGARTVVLPAGTDEMLHRTLEMAADLSVRVDDGSLTAADLDATDAVVTASSVGIAETGTIVLDHGPGQGRRALSLVPDRHICVVRAADVVSDVPEAVARLATSVRAGRPLTWISGPSATSDIELSRVEGVHGPRHLWVILVEG